MDGKESSLSCGSLNGLVTMRDPEALDCPVCCDGLTIPIFQDIYSHFDTHKIQGERKILGVFRDFMFGLGNPSRVVMDDHENGPLFVAQFFIEPHGVYVTMSCIAPPTDLEVGEFSCHITTSKPYSMTFEFPIIKKTRKLNDQFPEDDFMLLPSYFFKDQLLRLRISVHKLN